MIDTSWDCPGSTCPESFRWDWVETTDVVFEPDYFTDEHCYDADVPNGELDHLDLAPPSHFQGSCGSCVLAATVGAMEIQHRINLLTENKIIMPAGVSMLGGNSVLRDRSIEDPEYDDEVARSLLLQQNDVSQFSMRYPMDYNVGSGKGICNPVVKDEIEEIVNNAVEAISISGGSPLGAAIWHEVTKFDVDDWFPCGHKEVADICEYGNGMYDGAVGVFAGRYAATEAEGLLAEGTTEELLCSFGYDYSGNWNDEDPCEEFYSVPGYVSYRPKGGAEGNGIVGAMNSNGKYKCEEMKKNFRNIVGDWITAVDLHAKAAGVICSTSFCWDLLSCAICMEEKAIEIQLSITAMLGTIESNACNPSMNTDYNFESFDEDYIARKLKHGPIITTVDWLDAGDFRYDIFHLSDSFGGTENVLRPSQLDVDRKHAVIIIGWETDPISGDKQFIVKNSHGEADGRYYYMEYFDYNNDPWVGIDASAWDLYFQIRDIESKSYENPGSGLDDDEDWDNDGLPNYADSCPFISDLPWIHYKTVGGEAYRYADDPDCDGISSACDNCPTIWNPPREDVDGDGVREQYDSDGDGVGDECDTCPTVYNPAHKDIDGDGYRDQFDLDGDGSGLFWTYEKRYPEAEDDKLFCDSTCDGNLMALYAETDECYRICVEDADERCFCPSTNDIYINNYDKWLTTIQDGTFKWDETIGGDICDIDQDGDSKALAYPDPEEVTGISHAGGCGSHPDPVV